MKKIKSPSLTLPEGEGTEGLRLLNKFIYHNIFSFSSPLGRLGGAYSSLPLGEG